MKDAQEAADRVRADLEGQVDFLTAKLAAETGLAEMVKADTLPTGEIINRYAETAVQINFKQEDDTEQGELYTIDEGTMVWLISNEIGTDGIVWSRVKVNGTEGYIRSEYLNIPCKVNVVDDH